METILQKEKEFWKFLYPGVVFEYKKVKGEWFVSWKLGEFSKGLRLNSTMGNEDVIKCLTALIRNFERIAVFNFIKQNK